MDIPISLIIAGFGVLLFLLLMVGIAINIKKLYIVPKANEILVRTGGKGSKVSQGAGLICIPFIHEVTRLSAQAVTIGINREGNQALRTGNYLLANVKGSMLVQVNPEAPEVAAQALGSAGPSELEAAVRQVADDLIDDAMRTAARKKTFDELNLEKEEVGTEIRKAISGDLEKLGIQLMNVSITDAKQQPFDPDDQSVDTARGRQIEAQISQKAAEETNRIENEAAVTIKRQDVAAEKATLAQTLESEKQQADQHRAVAEYRAEQAAETRKKVLAQEQAEALAEAEQARAVREAQAAEARKAEEAEIAKEQAIAVRATQSQAAQKVAQEQAAQEEEAARIAKQKAVQAAEIAKSREIESATIEKEQAVAVANEQRQQAVETAEVSRQVAVAQKREEEAAARAKQATAEAAQRKAEEQVLTVKAEAEAEREKRIVTIKAEEEAQKEQIAADREAYVEAKRAEGARDAAIKMAEAVEARAKGDADAKKAAAQGDADSVKIAAEAYKTDVSTRAQADADAADLQAAAKIKLAEATLKEGEAAATAERLMQEARNTVDNRILMAEAVGKFIDQAPAIVGEIMEPIGRLGQSADVKILQMQGLGGGDGEGGDLGLPGTVLNTGMAALGLKEMMAAGGKALMDNPDLQQLGGLVKGVVKEAVREATRETTAVLGSSKLPDASEKPASNGV